MMSTFVTMTAN